MEYVVVHIPEQVAVNSAPVVPLAAFGMTFRMAAVLGSAVVVAAALDMAAVLGIAAALGTTVFELAAYIAMQA